MERVEFDLKVYDNFIEIIPNGEIKDNSIYEIRIGSIKALDKNKSAENLKLEFATQLTPSYCSLEAVNSLVESYQIPEDKILYYIREASLFAEYVKGTSYEKDNVPFEVVQYVKYKAAYDSLMRFLIEKSSHIGVRGQIGEISFENPSDFPIAKDLLKELKDEIAKWEEHLKGYGFAGRAKPLSAIRGINANSPYATSFSNYSRDVGGN